MKAASTAAGILIAVIILSTVYLAFFVKSPADVASSFVDALNEANVENAFKCVDPKYEKTYYAASNIFNKVVGVSLTDVANLLPLVDLYSSSQGYARPKMQIKIVAESISGPKVEQFGKLLGAKINGIEKLLGDTASVKVELTESPSGKRTMTTLLFKNFGQPDWRIIDEK